MSVNIPETTKKRIVIIGAGFGGLRLAEKLVGSGYQVVLIDKNNYHQFQPLFYQVATSGIEPSSILFPLRKIFQNKQDFYIRIADVYSIDTVKKQLSTSLDVVWYDYLVIATGVKTNYFGMKNMETYSFPMKTISEAMALRNRILLNLEKAVTLFNHHEEEKESLLNIFVVGGGPTGVEVSGAIAEMKKFVLPKDYPDLDFNQMKITLVEGDPKLLGNMSENASKKSVQYLQKMGVDVMLNTRVTDFDGEYISFADGKKIKTKLVIWAAGISGVVPAGIAEEVVGRGRRIFVDDYNRVKGHDDVFAIGDIALMINDENPKGHPQVAQVAIQQGKNVARNFKAMIRNEKLKPFKYIDRGSLATIGRNRAVADLSFVKFGGFLAWMTWMFVHLMAILGVKNRLLIFINWMWNYITYDQSLRLILKAGDSTRKGVTAPVKNVV
ncbi:MAG: NAD(P)/FAD-dependent oxidoreductase [Methylococcaceae bacterium]|nr:NAD(P)/FAD-dependent oxidoreductase [Prolixibacteraceae bacterium]